MANGRNNHINGGGRPPVNRNLFGVAPQIPQGRHNQNNNPQLLQAAANFFQPHIGLNQPANNGIVPPHTSPVKGKKEVVD